MTRMRCVLVLALVAACGGKEAPQPSCAEAATGFARNVARKDREAVTDLVAERCHGDGWPARVRACLLETEETVRLDDFSVTCLDRLDASQRSAFARGLQRILTQDPPVAVPVIVTEPVDAPEASAHESLVIEVSTDAVRIGGKRLTDDELQTLFRAAAARSRKTQVVLQCDPGLPHGRVVALMELAKAAGLERLAIGTTP
jgi:biopolymer transport protein ExbD